MKSRIVFMGSPAFAVPSFLALLEQPDLYDVVGVFTQPDRPAGRGRKITPCAVKTTAEDRNIQVFQPFKMKTRETRDTLASLSPSICIVASYGRILPAGLLKVPQWGCINVHASLLPKNRGASPIARAIMQGDAQTGVSIMQMNEGLDTGPVYTTTPRAIGPTETLGELTTALGHLGAQALMGALPGILSRKLVAVPQNNDQATYAPLLCKADGCLDFTQDAEMLVRQIRGLNPWPGCFTHKGSLRVSILSATALKCHDTRTPGTILSADARGVVIACGQGALLLDRIKPAGKKEMSAGAWVAGRGVCVGEVFGALL